MDQNTKALCDGISAQFVALNQGITAVWSRVQSKDVAMAALLSRVTAAESKVQAGIDASTDPELLAQLQTYQTQLAAAISLIASVAPEVADAVLNPPASASAPAPADTTAAAPVSAETAAPAAPAAS